VSHCPHLTRNQRPALDQLVPTESPHRAQPPRSASAGQRNLAHCHHRHTIDKMHWRRGEEAPARHGHRRRRRRPAEGALDPRSRPPALLHQRLWPALGAPGCVNRRRASLRNLTAPATSSCDRLLTAYLAHFCASWMAARSGWNPGTGAPTKPPTGAVAAADAAGAAAACRAGDTAAAGGAGALGGGARGLVPALGGGLGGAGGGGGAPPAGCAGGALGAWGSWGYPPGACVGGELGSACPGGCKPAAAARLRCELGAARSRPSSVRIKYSGGLRG